MFKVVDNIVNAVNQLLDANISIIAKSQRTNKSSTSLLKSLDTMAITVGNNVKKTNKSIFVKQDNIALTVLYTTRKNLTIYAEYSTKKIQIIISDEVKIPSTKIYSWMSVPDTTFSSGSELVYSYFFKTSLLFLTKNQLNRRKIESPSRFVQSTVLSVSFESGAKWNLSKPIKLKFEKNYHTDIKGNNTCQFWQFRKGKITLSASTSIINFLFCSSHLYISLFVFL